jgi:8-oxo-dGTP pyrophosphatase MutT (NUDIX family)
MNNKATVVTDDPSGESGVDNGVEADRAERLTRIIRDQSFPNVRPRDSATLILIDRAEAVPKVLLGRRHTRHRFLPGKFVFPGGRIEPSDRKMAALAALHERDIARLMRMVRRPSAVKSASFALAAVRETYEETGLMVGVRRDNVSTPPGAWEAFGKAGVLPDLGVIHFIARAITPPGRPLRFDSRFFAADVATVVHREDGMVGPDAELVELVWLPITEAKQLEMAGITAIVLEDLQDRIAAGMSFEHPTPLYRMLHRRMVREIL